MAFSKAHKFKSEDYHLSLVCFALSHPARVQIIKKLCTGNKCISKNLFQSIPLHKNTISQHIKILREMQIISCESSYPTVSYWFNQDLPETTKMMIDVLLNSGISSEPLRISEIKMIESVRRATTASI